MVVLNKDNIINHKDNLEKEEGLLPILVLPYINIKVYFDNLKRKKLFYNHIQKEIFLRREFIHTLPNEDLLIFEENELIDWLNNHKEYMDIIL